ncbi:MAG: hypothetical protein AB1758_17715, partial [Candidatus Eremiobacterota bacterium]
MQVCDAYRASTTGHYRPAPAAASAVPEPRDRIDRAQPGKPEVTPGEVLVKFRRDVVYAEPNDLDSLPEAMPVEGSKLHPNMVKLLGTLSERAVLDAKDLLGGDAVDRLTARGFQPERSEPGVFSSYTLGLASPFGKGQRVVFTQQDRT